MKAWTKLLIGSVLGILLGLVLPSDNQSVLNALAWVETLAIGIGRYTVVPIIFFSLSIAVYELHQDRQFWALLLRSILVIVVSAVFVVASGVLIALIFNPARIPLSTFTEEQYESVIINAGDYITNLFPSNMFNSLTGDGLFLLPVCVFAFFLGIGLSYDKKNAKQITVFIDSLSRVFYHIATVFSEILGIVMIALAAYWAVRFRNALQRDDFKNIILILGIYSFVLGFGILPLFLYFIKPKCNPWAVLYGSFGQAISAFFSGDVNFSLPVMLRNLNENSGCRRRSSVVTISLFTIFGRAGSAMAAAIAFIVVIKSYVYLGFSTGIILSIIIRAVLVSFLLAARPGNGAYTALAVLCIGYGQGYEAGYLIFKPIAFYLVAIGTFLDVMLSTFGSYAIARVSGFQKETG